MRIETKRKIVWLSLCGIRGCGPGNRKDQKEWRLALHLAALHSIDLPGVEGGRGADKMGRRTFT